jgi:hypothetical protein
MNQNSVMLSATIVRASRYDFFVESHTNAGNWYRVQWSKDQKRFYCSCMDSITRTHECKHGAEVRQKLQELKARKDQYDTDVQD